MALAQLAVRLLAPGAQDSQSLAGCDNNGDDGWRWLAALCGVAAGTNYARMAERARVTAEHGLRVLRITLRDDRGSGLRMCVVLAKHELTIASVCPA
jgi:hypothetical protein